MGLYELLGYRRRWQVLSGLRRTYRSSLAPVVIGGCGGSGTTLLRACLDAHPEIACGPESTVFLRRVSSQVTLAQRLGMPADLIDDLLRGYPSQAQFIEAFGRAVLQQGGKGVWADKTPENIGRIAFVFRHFPGARFVHVVRDGRDVACSIRHSSWMKLPTALRGAPEGLRRAACYWASRIRAGLAYRSDPRYTEVRYEDLVREPERTLRHLLNFLEVQWSDAVLDRGEVGQELNVSERRGLARATGPIYLTSVGRWQTECTASEASLLQSELASELATLGYLSGRAMPRLQLVPAGLRAAEAETARQRVAADSARSAAGD